MHFQTLLNIYKSIDSATFRFLFFPFTHVKGNFVLASALASNNLSVFSPQGPTEGCGVIPFFYLSVAFPLAFFEKTVLTA